MRVTRRGCFFQRCLHVTLGCRTGLGARGSARQLGHWQLKAAPGTRPGTLPGRLVEVIIWRRIVEARVAIGEGIFGRIRREVFQPRVGDLGARRRLRLEEGPGRRHRLGGVQFNPIGCLAVGASGVVNAALGAVFVFIIE